jgi:hypothetical protein
MTPEAFSIVCPLALSGKLNYNIVNDIDAALRFVVADFWHASIYGRSGAPGGGGGLQRARRHHGRGAA